MKTIGLQVSEVPARDLHRRNERHDCQPEYPVALTHELRQARTRSPLPAVSYYASTARAWMASGNGDPSQSAGDERTARTSPTANRVVLSCPSLSSKPGYARRQGLFCISRIHGTRAARPARLRRIGRVCPCGNFIPIQCRAEAGSHSEKIQRDTSPRGNRLNAISNRTQC